MLMMNSGKIQSGSPAMGSWINYGLGTANKNLPGFVVMLDPTGGPISGAKNWSSGYMPASYQGTVMKTEGAPLFDLKPPAGVSPEVQQELQALQEQQVEFRRKTRELEKEVTREFRRKLATFKFGNSFAMPALVILFGIGLAIFRRAQTQAR